MMSTLERDEGMSKVCHVFADSIDIKQKIYCFFADEGRGWFQRVTLYICGCHIWMVPNRIPMQFELCLQNHRQI